uniref:Uncharacterized protein n=1 Tax=Hyaloperonospora arabidopsidis (strain Emoy2) TaxID=559515 RepID=M4BPC1_HYAAE
MAKASASRTAQKVAEGYEYCFSRRFGDSKAIYHDRDRDSCQTSSERLTVWATGLGQVRRAVDVCGHRDRVREDFFYLVHGWDARSTLEATLPIVNVRRQDSEPRRWRYRIQSQYQRAREQVDEKLQEASQMRVKLQNEGVVDHKI